MIRPRHPEVADHMVLSLSHGRGGFHSEGATECRDRLVAAGIDAPECGDVDWGQRPGFPPDEFPNFLPHRVAVAQRGPMAGIPFYCSPVSPHFAF